MSPASSIAWRTLEAETTPVAARMRPARTSVASATIRGSIAARHATVARAPGPGGRVDADVVHLRVPRGARRLWPWPALLLAAARLPRGSPAGGPRARD